MCANLIGMMRQKAVGKNTPITLVALCLAIIVGAAYAQPNASPLTPAPVAASPTEITAPSNEGLESNSVPSDTHAPVPLLKGTAQLVLNEPVRPITLPETLNLADSQNLSIRISEQDLTRERWLFYNRLTQFLPEVRVFYTNRRIDGTILVGGAIPINNIHTTVHIPGVMLESELFNGFGKTLNSLSQRMLQQAAKADVRRTQADILLDAHEQYQNLLLAKVEVAIQGEVLREAESNMKIIRAKFLAGSVPKLDVLQSEAEEASALQLLITFRNNFHVRSAALARTLNLPILTELLPQDTAVAETPLIPETLSLEQLVAVAEQSRPEIARERFRIKASQWNQWSALSNGMPTVVLNHTTQAIGTDLHQLPNYQTTELLLNWNVGRSAASSITQFQARRADTERARLVLEQTVNEVQERVAQSYYDSQSKKEEIKALRQRYDAQYERYRLSKLRWENGLITTTDFIIAEVAKNQAQRDLARSILEYNVSQARLLHSIGLISIDTILDPTKLVLPKLSLSKPALQPVKPVQSVQSAMPLKTAP